MKILNLCVLASTKQEKYKERLKKFIDSYGVKNVYNQNYVKIIFLVDEGSERPDFVTEEYGWFIYEHLPIGLRFIHYLKNNWEPALWTMQVDDDSSTDVDKTIELLNQFYDASDSMILMGGRNVDLELGLQKVVKDMGIKNILYNNPDINNFKDIPYFVHAWEPSILSDRAVRKIQRYKDFDLFYFLNIKHNPVFGDQPIYLLAKLAKIPIVEALFLCPYDRPEEYSAVNPNGRYSHIHYVKEDLPSYKITLEAMEKYKI
jgi:hypothetical protein